MKKFTIVLGLALYATLLAGGASAQTYECYRYIKGHPTGSYVNIKADSKTDAEVKALKKMAKLGGKVDSVNCKIKI